jgi:hypothetical protein
VHGQPFYLSALVVISVNRFILSALSASLPHVVQSEQLVTANAISVTAGAVVAAFGGGAAIGIRALFGDGNGGYAIVALGAALFYTVAGGRAIGFRARQLGPDDETRTQRESVRNVLTGMAAGLGHIRSRPAVLRAFTVIGIHRFAYGITAICTLLLYRNYFTDEGVFRAGLAGLGQIVAAIAVGGGVAAAITPMATRRLGYVKWSAILLVGAAVVELVLGLPFQMQTFVPAAGLLGLAAQGVKICVDTVTAQQVADDFRGRVFSIYDTLFNIVFVASGVLTALVLPENGRSSVAILVIAVAYGITGAVYYFAAEPPAVTRSDRGLTAVAAELPAERSA